MANPPIEPTPKQPDIEQPGTPEMPKVEGEAAKPFDLGASQVSAGMQLAMQHYLKGGLPSKWKDAQTGEDFQATTESDPNPPKGTKNAQLVTITAMRNGHETGKTTFTLVETNSENMTAYSVYNKPGNEPLTNFDTTKIKRVPNNLGALMREDPKLGGKLYHALIIGMAMNMMRQMRKKQANLFKQQG